MKWYEWRWRVMVIGKWSYLMAWVAIHVVHMQIICFMIQFLVMGCSKLLLT